MSVNMWRFGKNVLGGGEGLIRFKLVFMLNVKRESV